MHRFLATDNRQRKKALGKSDENCRNYPFIKRMIATVATTYFCDWMCETKKDQTGPLEVIK